MLCRLEECIFLCFVGKILLESLPGNMQRQEEFEVIGAGGLGQFGEGPREVIDGLAGSTLRWDDVGHLIEPGFELPHDWSGP